MFHPLRRKPLHFAQQIRPLRRKDTQHNNMIFRCEANVIGFHYFFLDALIREGVLFMTLISPLRRKVLYFEALMHPLRREIH